MKITDAYALCERCKGTGVQYGGELDCSWCHGTGRVTVGAHFRRDHEDLNLLADLLHEGALLLRRGITGDVLRRDEADRADALLALLPTRDEIRKVKENE